MKIQELSSADSGDYYFVYHTMQDRIQLIGGRGEGMSDIADSPEDPRFLQRYQGFYRNISAEALSEKWEAEIPIYYSCGFIDPVDGERHSFSVSLLPYEDKTWFIAVRQALPEQGRGGEHLELRSSMLSSLSHEIRTPLNNITGLVTLAQAESGDMEKPPLYYDKIKEQASYLLGLINNILDMSRLESGKLRTEKSRVDISHLIASVHSLFLEEAEKKSIMLTADKKTEDLPLILCDEIRIKQILVNLLSNAVKFTPSGGKVDLGAWVLAETEERVKMVFRVKDNGVGIKEAALQRIFSPYEQEDAFTNRLYGGSGLGLAISKRMTELLGGEITVESVEGKGSLFQIILEFEKAFGTFTDKMEKNCREEEKEKYNVSGMRVLLAEDNDIGREVIEKILSIYKVDVTSVCDGLEAVEEFASAAEGTYDLILMDIQMPVMDGLAAADKIRGLERLDAVNIPIYALTANSFEEDIKLEQERGMDGHFNKPVDYSRLLETLSVIKKKA